MILGITILNVCHGRSSFQQQRRHNVGLNRELRCPFCIYRLFTIQTILPDFNGTRMDKALKPNTMSFGMGLHMFLFLDLDDVLEKHSRKIWRYEPLVKPGFFIVHHIKRTVTSRIPVIQHLCISMSHAKRSVHFKKGPNIFRGYSWLLDHLLRRKLVDLLATY